GAVGRELAGAGGQPALVPGALEVGEPGGELLPLFPGELSEVRVAGQHDERSRRGGTRSSLPLYFAAGDGTRRSLVGARYLVASGPRIAHTVRSGPVLLPSPLGGEGAGVRGGVGLPFRARPL